MGRLGFSRDTKLEKVPAGALAGFAVRDAAKMVAQTLADALKNLDEVVHCDAAYQVNSVVLLCHVIQPERSFSPSTFRG